MKKNILLFFIVFLACLYAAEFIARQVYLKRLAAGRRQRGQNILILGDSQSLYFPALLQSKLPPRYRVINDSESGSGPDLYLAKMHLFAGFYKPQLIIVSICVSNDIFNLYDFLDHPLVEGLKLYFGKRFYLYHLIRKTFIFFKYKRYAKIDYTVTDNRMAAPNPYLAKEAKEAPYLITDNILLKGERINKAFGIMERFIRDIASLAQKQNIPLLLLIIPDAIQVNMEYANMYRDYGFVIPEDLGNPDLFQQRLGQLAAEEKVYFLDVLPEFKKKDRQDLYYLNDSHPNEKGREVIAGLIIDFLKNKGLPN